MTGLDEARQILDGVMLSDGGLRHPRKKTHNSYFYLSQSFGSTHLDWILSVKEALEVLGFSFSSSVPHIEQSPAKGRKNPYICLWSKYSSVATSYYNRWYEDRHKLLPGNFTLSPTTLANWFIGDGTSAWVLGNLVTVCFATHAFKVSDVQRLAELLAGQGVDAYQGWNKGCPVIYVTTIDGVTALMDLVEPHILPSFSYKIKRPRRKNDYPRRTRRVW